MASYLRREEESPCALQWTHSLLLVRGAPSASGGLPVEYYSRDRWRGVHISSQTNISHIIHNLEVRTAGASLILEGSPTGQRADRNFSRVLRDDPWLQSSSFFTVGASRVITVAIPVSWFRRTRTRDGEQPAPARERPWLARPMPIYPDLLPSPPGGWSSDNLPRARIVGKRVAGPELDRKDRECLRCLRLRGALRHVQSNQATRSIRRRSVSAP
jgi:hypothetical protein